MFGRDVAQKLVCHPWQVIMLASTPVAVTGLVSAYLSAPGFIGLVTPSASFLAYLTLLFRFLYGNTWYYLQRHPSGHPGGPRKAGLLDEMAMAFQGVLLTFLAATLGKPRAFLYSLIAFMLFDVLWLALNAWTDLRFDVHGWAASDLAVLSTRIGFPGVHLTALKWLANNLLTLGLIVLVSRSALSANDRALAAGLLVCSLNTLIDLISTKRSYFNF